MQLKKLLLIVPFALLLAGCTVDNSSLNENKAVNEQQKIFVNNQPAPVFDWSLERHLLTQLYKARNEAVNTHSAVRDLNGKVYFECDSIGFPIPANTQLTNPETDIYYISSSGTHMTMPQAEPNGLYSSPSTSGTFVFCLNDDGTVSPSYFEANVETHAQKLKIKTSK